MQLKPGTTLQNGKYEIVKTLGQGGFGITYEAENVLLRRKFALKEFFMKDCCERDVASSLVTVGTGSQRSLVEKFRGKFIREAQMMAGLEHPNIVRVTDVFEENGTAYYVMENLPGGSLAEKVKKEGAFSESLAVKYIRQVADALSYIHSRNTVHLDVKPSNILLNTRGEAVLIDFGISKHYDDSGEQTSSTPVGISKGYAPIEQGREGDVSQFKPSTDIYALGATLYHLVTGIVPPEASIVYEDGLERPQGVSDRIWKAVESAMQPKRKDRPQTVAAFLTLLGTKVKTEVTDFLEPPIVPEQNEENPSNDSESTVLDRGMADSVNGHKWVDLGLGVKWATCNIGASSPGDDGDYFAWGETAPKTDYAWENYKFRLSGGSWRRVSFNKYNTVRNCGTVDNKDTLELSDDTARANWGGSWRMPTDGEWTELREKCTWTWTTQGDRKGYKVTSKTNGNSIFLPAAGYRYDTRIYYAGSYGYYWSSSLYSYSYYAYRVYFNSDGVRRYYDGRFSGFSVRPVIE